MTEVFKLEDGTDLRVGYRLDYDLCVEFLKSGGIVSLKYHYPVPTSCDVSYRVRLKPDSNQWMLSPPPTIKDANAHSPIMEAYGWLHNGANKSGEGWHAAYVDTLPSAVAVADRCDAVGKAIYALHCGIPYTQDSTNLQDAVEKAIKAYMQANYEHKRLVLPKELRRYRDEAAQLLLRHKFDALTRECSAMAQQSVDGTGKECLDGLDRILQDLKKAVEYFDHVRDQE